MKSFEEIMDKIHRGEEGSIQFLPDDAWTLAQILMRHGYAVLLTGGDIDPDIRLDWVYAGATNNLDYASRANVCFSSAEYLDSLWEMNNETEDVG